jgi:hypothetical protein
LHYKLDKNPKDWQQLIANNPVYSVSGQNPVTYKGVNAISLAITNADRGNTDNRFIISCLVLRTTGIADFSINCS